MKFKSGDICVDKSNENIKLIILKPKYKGFSKYQKYKVSWYDYYRNRFDSGISWECELKLKK